VHHARGKRAGFYLPLYSRARALDGSTRLAGDAYPAGCRGLSPRPSLAEHVLLHARESDGAQSTEGRFSGQPFERSYKLIFHHLPTPVFVRFDDADTGAWQWTADTRQLSLPFIQSIDTAARIQIGLLPGAGRS
jgi:hypothetical protein